MNRILTPFSSYFVARRKKQQQRTALWSPAHWGATATASGNLELDGVRLPDLVQDQGSPLLAVSNSRLCNDASRFLSAIKAAFPNSTAAYSYKTNCIPGVLRILHEIGFAAEVISPYELWLAEKLGVPGDRIVVNGVNKTHEYIDNAVRLGVSSINIDERDELEIIVAAARNRSVRPNVSLRLRLDPHSHFGLDITSGEADFVAGEIARQSNAVEFRGLHFHLLADNNNPNLHTKYQKIALDFARQIRERHGLTATTLNVGGGLTVPTIKVMSRYEYALQRLLHVPCCPPDPASFVRVEEYTLRLAQAWESDCAAYRVPVPHVVFEPGRAITSQSHVMLTRIHAIKANSLGPEIAMTDAGKILTSYPCDYEYHQMFAANRMKENADRLYHLMGRLCTSADWLAKFRCLPALQRGDTVAIMDAGAYFTSYASNFAFPRPKIVLLEDGQVSTLRDRETYDHLTAMDRLESHA